jgi:hypothetical protein
LKYQQSLLEDAHQHCSFHLNEIVESTFCGCFYCLSIFKPAEIVEWTDENDARGKTALCPRCGIDSVIGDKAGFPIDDELFLKEMYHYWF